MTPNPDVDDHAFKPTPETAINLPLIVTKISEESDQRWESRFGVRELGLQGSRDIWPSSRVQEGVRKPQQWGDNHPEPKRSLDNERLGEFEFQGE